MSTFKSESSKLQSQDNVNKLLLSFLPGSEDISSVSTKRNQLTSGALIIHQKILSKKDVHANTELRRRLLRKEKQVRRHKILENVQKSKELSKIVKINKLKTDKKYNDEGLQEIINKKLGNLKSWENSREGDLRSLEKEILSMTNKEHSKRRKVKLKNQKKMDFNRKLQRGIVAYPGLTPGLAPVDLTDDEEDSD